MDTKNANAELRNLPIGVFDSGVGGLTVAREIFRNLPNEKIIYFGDTARVPYGNKSKETIIRYSRQISKFLLSQNVKAIVIACNTASALALNELKEEVDVPVIGVVEPGARAAAAATKNGRIGVIGTEGTINSGLYTEFIKKIRPDCEIFGQPCPLFVSLVEEGMIDDEVTITMIHRYLDKMIEENNIDALILGCTHYPLLRTIIAREIGDGIGSERPPCAPRPGVQHALHACGPQLLCQRRRDEVPAIRQQRPGARHPEHKAEDFGVRRGKIAC